MVVDSTADILTESTLDELSDSLTVIESTHLTAVLSDTGHPTLDSFYYFSGLSGFQLFSEFTANIKGAYQLLPSVIVQYMY